MKTDAFVKPRPIQISVPFTKKEWARLNTYLFKTGFKKGAFVHKAIISELDRQESQA